MAGTPRWPSTGPCGPTSTSRPPRPSTTRPSGRGSPPMQIRLHVIEGPNQGKEFSSTEQGCILVGRDSSGSRAHFRLSPRDQYVSRNHFLVEFQPPNCYVRDNGSKNGTLLKAVTDRSFRRV